MPDQKKNDDILSRLCAFCERGLIELILRCGLGLVFLVAAFPKIQDPMALARIIDGYGLMPDYVIDPLAHILPWVEVAAGFSLLLGIFPRYGLYLINSMLVVFIVAITINVVRGHEFNCGCFSVEEAEINPYSAWWLLVRDYALLALGLHLLRAPIRWHCLFPGKI